MKAVLFLQQLLSVLFFILLVVSCGSSDEASKEKDTLHSSEKMIYKDDPSVIIGVSHEYWYEEPWVILYQALQKIKIQPESLSVPKYEEADYNMIAPLPILNQVMNHPLQLPAFTEYFSKSLDIEPRGLGGALNRMLHAMNGRVDYTSDLQEAIFTYRPCNTLNQLQMLYEDLFPNTPQQTKWDTLIHGSMTHSSSFILLMSKALWLLDKTVHLREEAFKDMSLDEQESLSTKLITYFFDKEEYRFLTCDITEHIQMIQSFRKIDFVPLFLASRLMADSVPELQKIAQKMVSEIPPAVENSLDAADLSPPDVLLNWETPVGTLLIGNIHKNNYNASNRAEIIIDLGGDDFYGEGVGSSWNTPNKVSMILDLSGSDQYVSDFDDPDGTNSTLDYRTLAAQAAGILGVSVLVDVCGNDIYKGFDHCQGFGYGGVGLLEDQQGDDRYESKLMAQGMGMFGFGLLTDHAGNDRYEAAGLAQGFGTTLGMGLIFDITGNDHYRCGADHPKERDMRYGNGQGAGLGVRSYPWVYDYSIYGGLGFLVDHQGDDRYEAYYHAQGGSYFMSLGALVDESGNDEYIGTGEHNQGGSMHLSAGILMDFEGNDTYFAFDSGQGSANDRSVAYLLDFEGNDRYRTQLNSQGYSRKGNSLAMFVDYEGNDSYESTGEPGTDYIYGQAYAQLLGRPDQQSTVIFFDLKGTDTYNLNHVSDGKEYQVQPQVIGIDTNNIDTNKENETHWFKHFIPVAYKKEEAPFNQFHRGFQDPIPLDEPSFSDWIHQKSKMILALPNTVYPFDQIITLLVEKKLTIQHALSLAAWLTDSNPSVRLFTTKILGKTNFSEIVPSMLVAIKQEKDPYIRKFMVESIGNFGNLEAIPSLENSLKKDSDLNVRYYCLVALEKLYKKKDNLGKTDDITKTANPASTLESKSSIFLDALKDSSRIIRFIAARMLAQIGLPSNSEPLLKRIHQPDFDQEDVFVKRSIAHALMASGNKEGILLMISTMDFYSLDNSYYAWGRDIGNTLRMFTNVNFVKDKNEPDRLNKDRWLAWWEENKDAFDITPFCPLAKKVYQANLRRVENKNDEAKAIYQEILATKPDFQLVQEYLKELESE